VIGGAGKSRNIKGSLMIDEHNTLKIEGSMIHALGYSQQTQIKSQLSV